MGWQKRFKLVSVGFLIGLGSLCFGLFVLTHWVERQLLTPDNWVTLVAPLPRQPVVSTALGSYITVQLFKNVPIQQEIADALPPKAAFLASPLSDQLESVTTKLTQRVVASDSFQTVWTAANRVALEHLLASARGQSSPVSNRVDQKFDINLADIKSTLKEKLGGTSAAIPSLLSSGGNPIDLSVDLKESTRQVRQSVRAVDFLAVVLPFICLASFVWALALSDHRRRTTAIILVTVILIILIELILVKVLRQQVLGQVQNKQYISAVSYIYDALLGLLVSILHNSLLVALIIFIVWALAGPAKWAQTIRDYLGIKRIKNSRAMQWWHVARQMVLKFRYYIWLAIAFLVLIYLAFVATPNWREAISALMIAAAVSGLVYLIAHPGRSFAAVMPKNT